MKRIVVTVFLLFATAAFAQQPPPPDDDPILQNAPYADGIVTMLMLTGRLKPV